MNFLSKVIVIAFIIVCFWIVSLRLAKTDWSSKPSIEQLKVIHNGVGVPLGGKKISEIQVSKITFFGYKSRIISNSSIRVLIDEYSKIAEKKKWTIKTKQEREGHYRVIYCDDSFAHDIEMNSNHSEQNVITTGTYWSSDPGDSRYCR